VFDLEGVGFLGGRESWRGYGPWLRKYEMLAVGHGTEVHALSVVVTYGAQFPATVFSAWPRPMFNQLMSFWKSNIRLPHKPARQMLPVLKWPSVSCDGTMCLGMIVPMHNTSGM